MLGAWSNRTSESPIRVIENGFKLFHKNVSWTHTLRLQIFMFGGDFVLTP